MSNRYRDSMDRLHFTQEQKQEMVDRLMEAGPDSSVRPLLRFRRFAAARSRASRGQARPAPAFSREESGAEKRSPKVRGPEKGPALEKPRRSVRNAGAFLTRRLFGKAGERVKP